MFERHDEPLASQSEFARRVLRYSPITAGIVLFSPGMGILGYHYLESLSRIDALLNASMILGGMGPVPAAALAKRSPRTYLRRG